MNPLCVCEPPKEGEVIRCSRHNCNKTADLYACCKDGTRFWPLWEQGQGPGQNSRQQHVEPISVKPSPVPQPSEFPCIHRGPELRLESCGCGALNQLMPVNACSLHGECTVHSPGRIILKSDKSARAAVCITCEQRTTAAPIVPQPVPPIYQHHANIEPACVVDSIGRHADTLHGWYRGGQSVFLVCGGPSLRSMPLDLLNKRGLMVAAVNNAAMMVKPSLWFCVDDPMHFHPSIFQDPTIIKFMKRGYSNGTLRTIQQDGTWAASDMKPRWQPAMYFYEHSAEYKPCDFLTRYRPSWGIENGQPGSCRTVLLVAIRLLIWLGFRRIFLLGADFHMTPGSSYGFDEPKDQRACDSNNRSYRIQNMWLGELRPHFEKAGIGVYNCTPGGRLNSLERVDFGDAVSDCLSNFQSDGKTKGLYLK